MNPCLIPTDVSHGCHQEGHPAKMAPMHKESVGRYKSSNGGVHDVNAHPLCIVIICLYTRVSFNY